MAVKIDKTIFRHGAIWVKADFHLHTRADVEFSYHGADDEFVPQYIERLQREDIRVGVITNHNKFIAEEYRRLSSYAGNRGILLLPGVELSVAEGASGVHVLVVFDPSWLEAEDRISRFIDSQFAGRDARAYQTENARSVKSLVETARDLENYGRPYFLVFAHVEDSKGLWTEMFTRLDDWNKPDFEVVRRRTLGFQKVRTFDKPEAAGPDREKVRTKLGAAYPAEVEGSDPKSLGEVGNRGRSCFIKLGDPSFEAVRFALESKALRVSKQDSHVSHSRIKTVSFSGGPLDGQRLDFSPNLNALIGVRGSGKSSIIESIRYALQLPCEDDAVDSKYKRELVAYALGSGGKVTIEAVDRFGQDYTVSRILGNQPDVYRGTERQPAGITIGEVVIRKPLCFGQKELSARDDASEDTLLERLIGPKLAEIRSKIEDKKREIRVFWTPVAQTGDPEDKIRDVKATLQNLNAQIDVYRELGIEDKLKERVDYSNDHIRLDKADRICSEFLEECDAVCSRYEGDLQNIQDYEPKQPSAFWTDYRTVHADFMSAFVAIKGDLSVGRHAYEKLHGYLDKHAGLIDNLSEKFAEIERKLAAELSQSGQVMARPDEYVRLQQKAAFLNQSLAEFQKAKQTHDSGRSRLETLLAELGELFRHEYQIACQEIEQINKASDSLTITYKYRDNKEVFRDFMNDVFRGTGIKGAVYDKLTQEFPDFVQMYLSRAKVREIIGEKTDVFFSRFAENLLDLLLWQVPNKATVTFKGKPLSLHSLGQRASALVLFVMSLKDNDVIIIDQPEDDLDNQTIYEDVIKMVVSLKPSVQFIFATHNANIPVLGDAEQVMACESSEHKIAVKGGSIDIPVQRRRIIDIMEGGSEAFARRKDIYGLWNEAM